MVGITKYNLQHLCDQVELANESTMSKLDRVAMLLIKNRHGLSVRFIAWLFDVSPKTVTNVVNDVTEALFKWAKSKVFMPSYSVREEEARFFDSKLIVVVLDGTEQRVQVASIKEIEQASYSGKKQQHSFTLLLACSPRGRIYFVSSSYLGSMNDMSLCHLSENAFWSALHKDEYIAADKGFIGLNKKHPTITPHKQTNNEPLSVEKETYNHEFAAYRCIVENVFAAIKKWRCCSEVFKWKQSDLRGALVGLLTALLKILTRT